MHTGKPHPNISKYIEDEHCVMWGFDVIFTTRNGQLTTPQKEYQISTGQRFCPEEDMLNKKGRRVRRIKCIEELKQLELCKKAHILEEEILAVVRALLIPIRAFFTVRVLDWQKNYTPNQQLFQYKIVIGILVQPASLQQHSQLTLVCNQPHYVFAIYLRT